LVQSIHSLAGWSPLDLEKLKTLVATPLSILLTGETGTGKELIARGVHDLFGHVKGAFSGALKDRPGALLASSGGTLFLDEIGDAPMSVQVSLLRALESQCVKPVGSEVERPVQLRVVAATSRRLFDMMCKGSFREDLYYRIAGHELLLPPLRERRGDIPDLSSELLKSWGHCGRLSQGARAGLLARDYPGNARELRHTLEKSAAGCPPSEPLKGEHIDEAALPSSQPSASHAREKRRLPPVLQERFDAEAQRWLASELLLLPPQLTRRSARTHERALLLCLLSTHPAQDLPRSIRLRVARLFARGWHQTEGGAPLRELAKVVGWEVEDTLGLVEGLE
jgi:transcriptional regulator with PAS, ATPase and Fis domain